MPAACTQHGFNTAVAHPASACLFIHLSFLCLFASLLLQLLKRAAHMPMKGRRAEVVLRLHRLARVGMADSVEYQVGRAAGRGVTALGASRELQGCCPAAATDFCASARQKPCCAAPAHTFPTVH